MITKTDIDMIFSSPEQAIKAKRMAETVIFVYYLNKYTLLSFDRMEEQVRYQGRNRRGEDFTAYSMLWWDGAYRSGERDAFIYSEIMMTEELLKYDNVRVFCFQGEEDIVTNLDHYMDSIHFSPEINKYMLDKMIEGKNELTKSNYVDKFYEVKGLSEKIVKTIMPTYEAEGRFVYDETE